MIFGSWQIIWNPRLMGVHVGYWPDGGMLDFIDTEDGSSVYKCAGLPRLFRYWITPLGEIRHFVNGLTANSTADEIAEKV